MEMTNKNDRNNKELTTKTVVNQTQEEGQKAIASFKAERRELIGKRGMKSKSFIDGSGKLTTKYYGKPVHYLDETSNVYREVDFKPRRTDDGYELAANTFKTYFHRHASDGKIFEMQKDLCRVGLISKDIAVKNGCESEECNEASDDTYGAYKVKLCGVKDGTDIEYTVDSERVKENIIVKQKADKYEYDFELSLENLEVSVSDDGKSLELQKKDSGKAEFYIPSPVMYDAAGNDSDSVYYEIVRETENMLHLKVIAEKEWMNAEERVFPVTIDPQVIVSSFRGAYDYGDSNYNDTVFRYETYQDEKLIGHELKAHMGNSYDDVIYSKLTVLRSKLPVQAISSKNLKRATVILKTKKGSVLNNFLVDGILYYDNGNGQIEISEDITWQLLNHSNDISIVISPYVYREIYPCDISFEPPVLELEYNNYVKQLKVIHAPDQKHYTAGENFNPVGMVVKAVYEDDSENIITDYGYSHKEETFTTFDDHVEISYEDITLDYYEIEIEKKGFNDRRPEKGKANVYKMRIVGQPGKEYEIELELADGATGDAEREGTPLTAYNLNRHIVVRAENIIGEIKDENLPARLRAKN